jgi:hypothetical protein
MNAEEERLCMVALVRRSTTASRFFFLTNKYCNGSVETFCEHLYVLIKSGFKITVDKNELRTAVTPFDPVALKYIGINMVFELLLKKFSPLPEKSLNRQ